MVTPATGPAASSRRRATCAVKVSASLIDHNAQRSTAIAGIINGVLGGMSCVSRSEPDLAAPHPNSSASPPLRDLYPGQ
eukprot:795697-Prymnesium_polylepis.1